MKRSSGELRLYPPYEEALRLMRQLPPPAEWRNRGTYRVQVDHLIRPRGGFVDFLSLDEPVRVETSSVEFEVVQIGDDLRWIMRTPLLCGEPPVEALREIIGAREAKEIADLRREASLLHMRILQLEFGTNDAE